MHSFLLALMGCSPTPPDVAIAPRPASSSADLVVTPDPPEGEVWRYRWARDGSVQTDLVGNRVPAARTRRGERWQVTVERIVRNRDSEGGTARVTITNGAPTVQAAVVEARDGLQAVVWADDPDGDPVTTGWSWVLGGDVVHDGGILPTDLLARDQAWTLRAWGDDGEDEGEVVEVPYVVGNQPPRILSAAISPASPTAVDPLTIVVDAIDPDGDALTASVSWRADGEALATGVPLAAGTAPTGPWIDAVVTTSDGVLTSAPFVVPGVRLGNTPPSIASATVEPAALAFGIGPTCVVGGWYDPDGDLEDVEVRWYIDSVLWDGIGSPSGTELVKGQAVMCEATPVDGESAGTAILSARVPVLDTPPSVARVFFEPEVPSAAEPLTARLETVHDPDGDLVVVELTWTVDGVEVATTTVGDGVPAGGEVFPEPLVRGSLIEVAAVPFDGELAGLTVRQSAEVGNAVPQILDLDISPNPPIAGSPIVPVVDVTDADADPIDLTFLWSLDGGAYMEADLVPGIAVQPGVVVALRARANDGFDDSDAVTVEGIVVP